MRSATRATKLKPSKATPDPVSGTGTGTKAKATAAVGEAFKDKALSKVRAKIAAGVFFIRYRR